MQQGSHSPNLTSRIERPSKSSEQPNAHRKERIKSARRETHDTAKEHLSNLTTNASHLGDPLSISKHLSPHAQKYLNEKSDSTMSGQASAGRKGVKTNFSQTAATTRSDRGEQLLKPAKGSQQKVKDTDTLIAVPKASKPPNFGPRPYNSLNGSGVRAGSSTKMYVSSRPVNRPSEEVMDTGERPIKRRRTETESRNSSRKLSSSAHDPQEHIGQSVSLIPQYEHAKQSKAKRKKSPSIEITQQLVRHDPASLNRGGSPNTGHHRWEYLTTHSHTRPDGTADMSIRSNEQKESKEQGRTYYQPASHKAQHKPQEQIDDSADELAGPSDYKTLNVVVPMTPETARRMTPRRSRVSEAPALDHRVCSVCSQGYSRFHASMVLRLNDKQDRFWLFDEQKLKTPFCLKLSKLTTFAFHAHEPRVLLRVHTTSGPELQYLEFVNLASAKQFMSHLTQVCPEIQSKELSNDEYDSCIEDTFGYIQRSPANFQLHSTRDMTQDELKLCPLTARANPDVPSSRPKTKLRDRLELSVESQTRRQSDVPAVRNRKSISASDASMKARTSSKVPLPSRPSSANETKREEQRLFIPPPRADTSVRSMRAQRVQIHADVNQDEDIGTPVPDVPEDRKYSVMHGFGPPWEFPLIYPKKDRNRAIIEFQDLSRLDEGEFLNDSIIDFYIRYLSITSRSQPDTQVYYFNTFFFTALTQGRTSSKGINYEAVKTWTRNVNIFDYDYLVVPINESFHWYVTIVCNLKGNKWRSHDHNGTSDQRNDDWDISRDEDDDEEIILDDSQPIVPDLMPTLAPRHNDPNQMSSLAKEADVSTLKTPASLNEEMAKAGDVTRLLEHQINSSTEGQNQLIQSLMGHESEKHAVNRTFMPKQKKRKPAPRVRSYDPDTVAIITLDSLGASHHQTVRMLKDYLVAEAAQKLDQRLDDSGIQGLQGKFIPSQNNYSDCGLYLLLYVKKFLEDPRRFATKLLKKSFSKADWPEVNAIYMRDELRQLIMDMHDEQEKERASAADAKRLTPKASTSAMNVIPSRKPGAIVDDMSKVEGVVSTPQAEAAAVTVGSSQHMNGLAMATPSSAWNTPTPRRSTLRRPSSQPTSKYSSGRNLEGQVFEVPPDPPPGSPQRPRTRGKLPTVSSQPAHSKKQRKSGVPPEVIDLGDD